MQKISHLFLCYSRSSLKCSQTKLEVSCSRLLLINSAPVADSAASEANDELETKERGTL